MRVGPNPICLMSLMRRGNSDTGTYRERSCEGTGKTAIQVMERGLRRNWPRHHLDLSLLAFRIKLISDKINF